MNAFWTLTLYIQHQPPGKEKEGNWLPAPDDILRLLLEHMGQNLNYLQESG